MTLTTDRRMSRGILGCTIALSSLALLSGARAADKPTIGVSVADQKSLFYVAAVEGMKDAAAKGGYDLRIASASNNSSLQIKQVQDLLVQNVKALVFISQDSTAAAAGVKAANKADVPVIAVDEKPEAGSGQTDHLYRDRQREGGPATCVPGPSSRWAARATSRFCAACSGRQPSCSARRAARRP